MSPHHVNGPSKGLSLRPLPASFGPALRVSGAMVVGWIPDRCPVAAFGWAGLLLALLLEPVFFVGLVSRAFGKPLSAGLKMTLRLSALMGRSSLRFWIGLVAWCFLAPGPLGRLLLNFLAELTLLVLLLPVLPCWSGLGMPGGITGAARIRVVAACGTATLASGQCPSLLGPHWFRHRASGEWQVTWEPFASSPNLWRLLRCCFSDLEWPLIGMTQASLNLQQLPIPPQEI